MDILNTLPRKALLPALCILWMIFFSVQPAFAAQEENGKQPAAAAQAEQPEEQKLYLISLYTLSSTLPRDYFDLQRDLTQAPRISELQEELPTLQQELQTIEWDITIAASTPDLSYHQLSRLENQLYKLKVRIQSLNDPIAQSIEKIDNLYESWAKKQEEVHSLQDKAQSFVTAVEPAETEQALSDTVNSALSLIESTLKPLLLAGRKISAIQVQIYKLEKAITELVVETREIGSQQTMPSMLSPEFYAQIKPMLWEQSISNISFFLNNQKRHLQQNLEYLTVGILATLFLAVLIRQSRNLVVQNSNWTHFTSHPLASAVFILLTSFVLLIIIPVHFLHPPEWDLVFQIPLLLAMSRLTRSVCSNQWNGTILRRVSLFLVVIIFIRLIDLPHLLVYLIIFYASVMLFLYYLAQLHITIKEESIISRVLRRSWGVLPLIIIVAGIAGYDRLALFVFTASLETVVACFFIWVAFHMFLGFLELLLTQTPFEIISKNGSIIVQQLRPLIWIAHTLFLLTILTVIWRIQATTESAFSTITSLGVNIFSISITPGFLLAVFLIIYAAILFSRATQAFLRQEILPRYRAEEGVQVSITRLVHYAILTIGFLVLLKVLGFHLNQLTILGGALGVGIGFGLQAIVNNFVSGLIMLFERPVKVGDIISLGTEFGTVKELGLRATIIETFDNAEIVVPNSDLITNQVTNWTLANKKVRVRVPVGVAYGTDISKVLEILINCANANPMVMTTPKPVALFLAFGSSSLDFELRVWIPDFNDKLTVLSELNQDIESELSLAGIEIPFPQTDLHFRSIDDEVARQLSGRALQSTPAEKSI